MANKGAGRGRFPWVTARADRALASRPNLPSWEDAESPPVSQSAPNRPIQRGEMRATAVYASVRRDEVARETNPALATLDGGSAGGHP